MRRALPEVRTGDAAAVAGLLRMLQDGQERRLSASLRTLALSLLDAAR
ncbi:hypothetical protein [Nonomuraea sp. NPDC049309]